MSELFNIPPTETGPWLRDSSNRLEEPGIIRIHQEYEGGIEDHRLASRGLPSDDKW